MERRNLGRTAVEVTELGFGTAPIGNLYRSVTDAEAEAALDAAWDAGIRYFDTAPHYGLGLAEQRLGAALAGRPRADYVVSTKVGRLIEPNPAPTGSDLAAGFDVPDTLVRRSDYTRDGIRRSLDASLNRLGLDHVEIVLVHDPDTVLEQTITESIPALIELRDEGVVGAIGVGMNQWQAPLRVLRETDVDVIMLAGRWTLVDRSGAELVEACGERGTSLLAAAPFNSGLLVADWPAPGAFFDYGPAPDEVLARAQALAEAATAHRVRLPQLAMQFALRSPAVASVVVGMRSALEVRENVALLAAPISADAWAAVSG
ncbi:MAG: D-threo-aldose 1-dehydrogenase [Pseudonocardiales bacterium]|nr:D-threo-aldose 1-dehydrogenase [Pseudonocardiales bacterium]